MSASQVRDTIKSGRSARTEGLSVKYGAAQSPKVAVVVSKKVAHTAAKRNYLRRLAYQSLPAPLPRAHMVLFVLSPAFKPENVSKLCSQLF